MRTFVLLLVTLFYSEHGLVGQNPTLSGYSAQTDPTSARQTDPTKTDGQFLTFDCCFLMIKDCF